MIERVTVFLPDGKALPEQVWQQRHRAIVLLLWAHVLALGLFALWRGYGPFHSLLEVVPIGLAAAVAGSRRLGLRWRAGVATIGLMTGSAVLVHLSGGVIEAHFHFFVMVMVVALYQDRFSFLVAIAYVIVGHGIGGTLWPEAVYSHGPGRRDPWAWAAIHGVAVLAASAVSLIAWRFSEIAQRDLSRSEERFRASFDDAPIGVALVTLDGAWIRANRALCTIVGYSEDELRARSITEITHPDDVEAELASARRMLAREIESYAVDKRFIHARGHIVWVSLSVSIVWDPHGAPLYTIGHVQDITERKRAEESRERLAAIVESSNDAIFGQSLDGDVTAWNSGAERMYGYAAAEIIGRRASIVPPERAQEASEVLEAIRRGRAIDRLETERVTKDGRRLHVAVTTSPIYLDGDIAGASTITRDITQAKGSERALRESEQRFRVMFDSSPLGISLVDLDGRPVHSNRAFQEMLGYTAEDLRATTVDSLTHPEDTDKSGTLFAELLQGLRDRYEIEKRYIRKDGAVLWAHLTVSAMRDEGGKVRFIIGMVANMSERKSLEDQLRHAQKMEAVGKLAGGVAHEFNNLLSIMQHYTGFVADELPTSGTLRQDLDEVLKAGDRAKNLVRQLLTFSRKEDTAPALIDLNGVVSETGRLLRRTLGEDIMLESHLDSVLHQTKIDAGQLEQVLMNLAFNARDAMPEGGVLTLETRNETRMREATAAQSPTGDHVALIVRDTGSGMSKEVMDRIFEPFFTTKPFGQGTGLGLATVYGIVQQAGGGIEVESEPGGGTTFRILLPAVPRAAGLPAVVSPEARAAGSGETILVAEDEEAVRKLVRRILARNGYDVVEAESGERALELLRCDPSRVDGVITDVVMPGMTGRQLVEEARAMGSDARTLYMSGYTDQIIAQRGVLEAGDRFIQKPFTAEELLEEVRRLLQPSDHQPANG
ncbi:hypothetical protein BH24ACT26_BH24ACT26_18650 [soil metagenome]